MPEPTLNTATRESPWTTWGRSLLAVAMIVALTALGIANVAMYSRWHEVEDGVLWAARSEGVTAIEIAPASSAAKAGVQYGDVLLAVNGSPVQTPADVIEYQHQAHEGTRLSYTLLRLGTRQALEISLTPAPRAASMYFVLAAVGLFTLFVGASVRLRRPRDQATLHFFWVCVAFFGVFTFTVNGPFDRLDWIFYWADAIAFALLPPLLLHFTLAFPERERVGRTWGVLIPLMYVPGCLMAAARIVAVTRASSNGPLFSRTIDRLDRIEQLYLFLCATAAVAVLFRAFREITSVTARRQLRWIAWGTARGARAFARDLNSDLDVVRLSQRLVARIVETLVVDRMALMLGSSGNGDDRAGDFASIGYYGFPGRVPPLSRQSSMMARLDAGYTVALVDDPTAAARFEAEEIEFWRDTGIDYFVPCVFEGRAIAVLALGRKETDEPFNSEDLALLTAVAAQVATAIENGRLYRELHLKAEELGRMREFNENILESLDDGLVVFDVSERIVRWNRALEEFYGVVRRDAVGRTLGDIFDVPFIEALRAARQEHPYGATLYRVPLSARKDDDSRILVNATVVPLQNPSGSDMAVSGTILLIEDITDRVRLEEQLQISEKMASIGLLAAGVAHEVNTPLTGISSFTQMLLDGADPRDPKTALLEKIEKQTFRAAKIVNGLLNLSRPAPATNERIDVDLNAVITDVFSLLEHQFEVGKIKARRELAPTAVTVVGIEHQLQQVFLNLFLNARDAMPRGGWLTVTTRIDGDRAVVEISDTGSGIPPEQLARIYDPFFTTKAIGRGTGLGLSITYGIVREHDGAIRCDSAIGQGTRFTLTLPLAPAQEQRTSGVRL